MADYREEKDSLGRVKVPKDALYGAQTQRAIENFDYCSRQMPDGFIVALLQVKKAAALANQQLECLDESVADLIVSACDHLLKNASVRADAFPVSVFQTGSGTSSNMNANEVIVSLCHQKCNSEAIKVHPNDHVNYGQSSNDVIPTSIQISALLGIVEKLLPAVEQFDEQLETIKQQYREVVKTGRTHLMDAMPLALGDEFATWQHQIRECRERLIASMPRLAEIPLGGTAIGTGINRHQDFPQVVAKVLSELTMLPIRSSDNAASRIASQDPTLELHGQIKVLATVVMKIANDLRWMNSGPNCGLGEIQLKALQPGSSIMPGKVNPVICESVLMMCTEVLGNDTTLTVANQSGNFQLNVMLPLIADKTLTSVELISGALSALSRKALVGFKVNEDLLKRQQDRNPILVTALNTRIGYELAAEIAKTAQSESRSVIDVALEKTDLTEAELRQLLDPMALARPHKKI